MSYGEGFGDSVGYQFTDFTKAIIAAGFTSLSSGSFREVYARGRVVIKIPYTTDGIIDNRVEAAAWKRYRNHPTSRKIRLAPCRLLPNLCLMMVMVDHQVAVWPDWAGRVDCGQIGTYKGQVVAYDYACDIVERREWETAWYGQIQSEWYGYHLRAEKRAAREAKHAE